MKHVITFEQRHVINEALADRKRNLVRHMSKLDKRTTDYRKAADEYEIVRKLISLYDDVNPGDVIRDMDTERKIIVI